MDGRVEKPLHRAVAIRAPAGKIAHGDVVGRTKRASSGLDKRSETVRSCSWLFFSFWGSDTKTIQEKPFLCHLQLA
jgi:hypothetical protein